MGYGRFLDTRRFGLPDSRAPAFPKFQYNNPDRQGRMDSIPLPTGINPRMIPEVVLDGPGIPPFGQFVPAKPEDNGLDPSQQLFLNALIAAVQKIYEPLRYYDMVSQPLQLTTVDSLVLPGSDSIRCTLIILNTDAANTLRFSFGIAAGFTTGIPLGPGIGFIFDAAVPQNDLHAIGSATPTTGLLMYGNKVLK